MYLRTLSFALSICLVSPVFAEKEEEVVFCEHPIGMCPYPNYQLSNVECELSCQPVFLAPDPPRIECSFDQDGYACQVWPRGPGLTYSFSTTSSIVLSHTGPDALPGVWAQCKYPGRSSVLWVRVTSPHALSSSASVVLSCMESPTH